jgi:SAM-dependent methyltransferase
MVLMLNWLFYRPTPGQPVRKAASPWQEYWGETYAPELKRALLEPIFEKLESEDKIGNLIVDIGSGASPVTRLLASKPGRKRIGVDIAADNGGTPDELRVRFDAEKVVQAGVFSFHKALLKICAFLEIDPKGVEKVELVDTVVVSDTLNYVDFRKVLGGVAKYLKPGGRLIVLNLPYRGNRLLFSGQGLKDNRRLYSFLEERHFEIQYKDFPKRPRNVKDESEELLVLVARKRAGSSAHDLLNQRGSAPRTM